MDVTANAGLNAAPGVAKTRGKPDDAAASFGASRSLANFLGSGACVFDYNGDGKADIFFVNFEGKGDAALFKNVGEGKFVNETKSAKLDFHGEGTSCAFGDYDNDGHLDLAIGTSSGLRLYHNEGNGTFKDVTSSAGINCDGLVLGISFIDYDQDGDLDLYVTRFADLPLENPGQPFAFPQNASHSETFCGETKGTAPS